MDQRAIVNPFLRGQYAAQFANQSADESQLQGLARLLQMQQAQAEIPYRMEALRAQAAEREGMARFRDAQIADMQRKAAEVQGQRAAAGGLAQLLAQPFQGVEGRGAPAPTSVSMNESDALRQVQEAEAQGRPARVDVPNPGMVQGLAVAADPQRAIPEILRQQRPEKPLTPRQMNTPVAGGYLNANGEFVKTAPEAVKPERKVYDAQRGGIVDLDSGVFTPAAAPGGAPLPTRATPERALPTSAGNKLFENQQNLRRAEQALALVKGETIKDENGNVLMTGDKAATGWKGLILPEFALQRMDPEGVQTRAAIGDLGSMIIHDRSGAAVTAAEFPRLRPFIPMGSDDQPTARKKLERFVNEYRNIQQEMRDFYKESGYKVPDVLRPSGATPPARSPQDVRSAADKILGL